MLLFGHWAPFFINDFLYICSDLTLLQGNGLCVSHLCIPSIKHCKHSVNVLCWINDPNFTESTPGPYFPSPISHWELAFLFWGMKIQNYILYSHLAFLKIIVETKGYSFKWTLMGKWVKKLLTRVWISLHLLFTKRGDRTFTRQLSQS